MPGNLNTWTGNGFEPTSLCQGRQSRGQKSTLLTAWPLISRVYGVKIVITEQPRQIDGMIY
jgi:hypothetical protein